MSKTLLDQPEIKKVYDEYNKAERKRLFKIVFWFAFFGMPAGISLDMQVYPAYVPYFLKLRLFSSLLVTLLLWIYYRPWAARFDRALFILLLMVPQGIITWMIYSTEGPLSPYYAGLNVVLVAFCMLLPWTYQETLVFASITFAGYIAACVAHGGVTFGGVFFNNSYFLFLTATFAVVGSYFTNRLRVQEFVNRYELDRNKKILETTNQKLVELDQMKTQFFANISHELRTPLTLLISPLEELLRQTSLDNSTREILKLMQGNAMRLLKLINDLLDLAKLDSSRMEVRKEPLAVEEFIKGLAQSVQGTARDKRVKLNSSVAPDLGVILADGDKLEKIILNLLFNSVKFTPAGGSVDLSAVWEDGGLVLRVKDTGMGISEK
ncbi:MAG TPA: histidine kinase dimerization/phospho-acceptor domain-containing protein, partial [bacterium]|nr:histidine kinase dimerization/phospho-acceptor domain-containing protein [bacterium]